MSDEEDDDDDCWDAFGSSSDEDDDDEDDEDDVDVNEFLQNEEEKNELLYDRPHKGSKESSGIISVKEKNKIASAIAMYLSQTFVKHNPQIRLSDRSVMVLRKGKEESSDDNDDDDDDNCIISKCLKQREIQVIRQKIPTTSTNITMVDAVIILDHAFGNKSNGNDHVDDHILSGKKDLIESVLCPGGALIFSTSSSSSSSKGEVVLEDEQITTSRNKDMEELFENDTGATSVLCTVNVVVVDDDIVNSKNTTKKTIRWIARRKKSIRVHSSTCPWLSSSHSVPDEEERLKLATVTLSSHEINSLSSTVTATKDDDDHDDRLQLLTDHSIQKAVQNMNNYGYCILPRLLSTDKCKDWGQAVIECVHSASKILLDRDDVDIYNPHSSQFEPQSYQELSMREDLRLDLRKGPALDRIRQNAADADDDVEFLRGNSSLLEIIRRTMNPRDESDKKLWLGNIGRFNFGGSGNDGSYQNLRTSDVGGIVSLPGAADQALHADTPHLFEHNIANLPAHYINMFAPCTNFNEQVGGTAFIHGSHSLEFTAKHYGQDSNNSIFYPYLVRPRLEVGDVVLFDCRILHFGLANTSKTIERCICYSNTWMDWFHDKKNWDKNRAIFDKNDDDNRNDDGVNNSSDEQKQNNTAGKT